MYGRESLYLSVVVCMEAVEYKKGATGEITGEIPDIRHKRDCHFTERLS